MRIIIEGPDGVGKTTLVNELADIFECDILHLTEFGSKNLEDYVDKANLNNIISDRSFLSEIAYATVFNRKLKIKPYQYNDLIKYYRERDWKIVILDADTDTIVKRLNLRGDEDEEKIKNIHLLRAVYRALSYFFDIPIIKVSELDVYKIAEELEGM